MDLLETFPFTCNLQRDDDQKSAAAEPAADATSPAGALPAPQQPGNASGALEISLDLPSEEGVQIADILFGGTQPKEDKSSSEEEWECVDTGQPVSAKKVLS